MPLDKKFLSQEEISWHRTNLAVTGINLLSQQKKLPVTGKHFLSQEVISCHSNKFPVTGKVNCDTRCSFFISVKGNKFPVTRNIVYFTGKDPSVTDTPFVTESILPVTGSFSCDMGILSCDRKCSSYYNTRSTVFLWSFGCLIRVFHFRDKCAGFTIKISCETLGFPGNLVPWFPGIIPPWRTGCIF